MTTSKDIFVSRCFKSRAPAVGWIEPGQQPGDWRGQVLDADWAELAAPVEQPLELSPGASSLAPRVLFCGAPDHWRSAQLATSVARQPAALALLHPFCAATALRLLDELEITVLHLLPWHLQALVAEHGSGSLRKPPALQVSGARCPQWLRLWVAEQWGSNLTELYCGAAFPAVVALDDPVGIVLLDPNGAVSAPGHTGRIAFTDQRVVTADTTEANQNTEIDRGEALYLTPDWGYIDAAGALKLMGRDDMLLALFDGLVMPGEAERVLESHPVVAAAAVLPIVLDDDAAGFFAVVELHQQIIVGQAVAEPSPLLEVELLDLCRNSLSAIKCPTGIAFVEQLPRTAGGRVAGSRLRALAEA